ncbi:MAG: signal peptide peptidase SppA [Calditerrivibrio sp.]|nr:signal peptide peptidase SppA [Calditerrivibrio sp.]MCA1980734.1 signal peptide peptidase SppA [Calditerrivibrio sp.]
MKRNWVKIVFKVLLVILISIFIVKGIFFSSVGKPAIDKKKVVVIDLEGIILESDKIIDSFKKYEKDDSVVGFIFRVNSPGGAVAPSQEIYKHIRSMKKPVFAAMSTIAASGGYYVASACDKIYALPGTLTGSIGVIMKFTDLSKIYDKVGIKTETIKSGKFKDIGSIDRNMTQDEKNLLQTTVDDVYNQFIDDILSKRNFIQKDELIKYADGRVFTGNEAKKLRLIDVLGSYEDAFKDMIKQKNVPDAELFIPKNEKKLIEKLLEETRSTIKGLQGINGLLYIWEG